MYLILNRPPTTESYTLSLHDALPISASEGVGGYGSEVLAEEPDDERRVQRVDVGIAGRGGVQHLQPPGGTAKQARRVHAPLRSEEHTSELQSHVNLVCRLLLEKKKKL